MNIDYLKSDEYKKKYEDLMKRCAEFTKEFSPPSPYELGFKAGWEAAKQEFCKDNICKDNTYVPDTTKQHQPAQTIGFQYTDHSIPCHTCDIDLSKVTNYVCMLSTCPSKIKTSNINLGIHT